MPIHFIASSKPRPSSPRIAACGTRTSSKDSDAGPHWPIVGISRGGPAGLPVDQEAGDAAVGALLLVGDREDDAEVGVVAAGDERLLAVDHPVVAVAYGGGAQVAGVRPGAGLGDREAADLLALDRRHQVLRPLLLVGVEQDVVGLAAELELHERPAELDLDQRRHHRAEAHAAVLLGRLDAEEAGLAGLGLEVAELVEGQAALVAPLPLQHGLLERDDLLGDEGADPLPDLALLRAQAEVHGREATRAGASGSAPRCRPAEPAAGLIGPMSMNPCTEPVVPNGRDADTGRLEPGGVRLTLVAQRVELRGDHQRRRDPLHRARYGDSRGSSRSSALPA